MLKDYGKVQQAVDTLLARNFLNSERVGPALTVISSYTDITDLDWLLEVFSTGAATTPEQAVFLFRMELEENAAPFS
jgi:hypothetical protein